MKTILIAALLLVAAPAFAQTHVVSGSNSGSTAASQSTQSQGNQQQAQANLAINSTTPADTATKVHYSGLSPDLVVGGYAGNASPDSCVSTAQAGGSAAGVAVVIGHGVQDSPCSWRRNADYRGRQANFYADFARAHPGIEATAMVAELHEMRQSTFDVCKAEGKEDGVCTNEADAYFNLMMQAHR